MNSKREKQLGIRNTARELGAKKMPTVDTSGRFKTKNKKYDTKITKNLIIEDFRTGLLNISVDWYWNNATEAEALFLCKPCFEQWLNDTGRLDWCKESIDYSGEYVQDVSTLLSEDYWDHADFEVKLKDLKAYILQEQLV
ncbi:MAG: hypothetical protein R2800_15030 [Flavipsychrobacter sp.]